ncbi:COM1 regulatory protein [Stachybotrys elegans]|uniref:COM1 regulatory protein n=1 Tax=Stachybotrys elegans TaxID=80388 RepID=A0A8K0SY36_9HYPO|nr:COM1 regulatory protein [Stachybotrys elegans]
MNSLKVPDSGILLGSSAEPEPGIPPQAFAISLSDNVIESMIKCVQNGQDIQLALGSTPTFLYGSSSHRIAPTSDTHPYDLYLTRPFESTREAQRIPHTSSLFRKPRSPVSDDSTSKKKSSQSGKSSGSSGLDSDMEALQNRLTAHDASRERARIVDKLPASKKSGKVKGKLLPGSGSGNRSVTTSPALNAVRSPPDTPAMSASQQAMERKKEQRFTLVHELAVDDRSIEYLKEKWEGRQDELQSTLEKVADYSSDSKTWKMKKTFWKELDVWNYAYDTQEERQKAIDHAIPQYDKQRLSSSEPEWERLLPKEDRGKGICLSRLQAAFGKGPTQPAPKINIQKADENATSKDDGDVLKMDKPKDGGESMSRSASNPLPSKPKKTMAQEAQVKRLLGKSKPTPQKTSPTKPKAAAAAAKTSTGRMLSQAIITNSDSSGDEAPMAAKTQPPPKPVPKPAPRSKEVSKSKDTVIVKQKPSVNREPIRQQPMKRPRDDDESSSSSGTPLSKRFKDKQALAASTLKHRAQESSSQKVRNHVPTTMKPKATSPTKSSPLASSPPTNASDLESEAPLIKKRKADIDSKSLPSKRQATSSVSTDVLSQAHKFKVFYQKYEALHWEISALDNPPNEKLENLLDMRVRLQDMKNQIYKQCGSD